MIRVCLRAVWDQHPCVVLLAWVKPYVRCHWLAGTEGLGDLLLYFLHTRDQTMGRHTSTPAPAGCVHWEWGCGSSLLGISRPVSTLWDGSLSTGGERNSASLKGHVHPLCSLCVWSSTLFSAFRTCLQTPFSPFSTPIKLLFFPLLHIFTQALPQLVWGTLHKIIGGWMGRTLPLDTWLGLRGTSVFEQHWKD